MNCEKQYIHIVRFGDTIYKIARVYNLTEEEILYLNPNIDPRNLRVGESIIICPRFSDDIPGFNPAPIPGFPQSTVQPRPQMPPQMAPQMQMPMMPQMNQMPGMTPGMVPQMTSPMQQAVPQMMNSMEQRMPESRQEVAMAMPGHSMPKKQTDQQLTNNMRKYWMEHVFWTRLLIISIIDSLLDTAATTKRLLKNPADIASVFKPYYGAEAAKKIENLLTEHLVIGEKLIRATKKNDTRLMAELDKQWYQNADKMAAAFAELNPQYNKEELKKMLYTHLDLTKKEVGFRLSRKYEEDVRNYDEIQQEILRMADYFVRGIERQF